MKVKMKQYEQWCLEYASRWNKKQLWDSFCLAKDAWLNGFRTGAASPPYRDAEVEVDIGECPQIGAKQIFSPEQFKKDMETFYTCSDLKLNVSADGLVSFQGTFKP